MTTTKTQTAAIETAIIRDVNGAASGIRLTFANGRSISLTDADIQANIAAELTWHGAKQKLVDAAAMSRNTDTGKAASIDDKFEAVKEVLDRLLAGQWNKAREGGGATGGLLLQALVKMYEGRQSPEKVAAFLEAKTDAEKAALRKNPKVAAIIETLRKPVDTKIDTDALLGDLE